LGPTADYVSLRSVCVLHGEYIDTCHTGCSLIDVVSHPIPHLQPKSLSLFPSLSCNSCLKSSLWARLPILQHCPAFKGNRLTTLPHRNDAYLQRCGTSTSKTVFSCLQQNYAFVCQAHRKRWCTQLMRAGLGILNSAHSVPHPV